MPEGASGQPTDARFVVAERGWSRRRPCRCCFKPMAGMRQGRSTCSATHLDAGPVSAARSGTRSASTTGAPPSFSHSRSSKSTCVALRTPSILCAATLPEGAARWPMQRNRGPMLHPGRGGCGRPNEGHAQARREVGGLIPGVHFRNKEHHAGPGRLEGRARDSFRRCGNRRGDLSTSSKHCAVRFDPTRCRGSCSES